MPSQPKCSFRTVCSLAALAAAMCVSPALAQQSSLAGLAGTWSGGGQVRLSDGSTERLSCRAFYTARDGGSGLGVALRCASASYKIDLRSSIKVTAGRVSGSWEERSFNAAGSVSGSSSGGSLSLSFSGTTTGSMSVSYGGSSQRVSITTSGGGLSRISLSLSRG